MARKIIGIVRFSLFYFSEVIKTNLTVMKEVLTPKSRMSPAFLKIELLEMSDFQLLVFSTLLTMTPGTVVMDISRDKKFIYLHCLYAHDVAEVRREILECYQQKVKELF
jgi:multicomponent Na+:H+ antiporter subunit E